MAENNLEPASLETLERLQKSGQGKSLEEQGLVMLHSIALSMKRTADALERLVEIQEPRG